MDEEGCQWAAAAEQPDDVSNKEETDSDSAMAAAAEQPDDVIGKEETDSADSETSEEAEYTERHGATRGPTSTATAVHSAASRTPGRNITSTHTDGRSVVTNCKNS